MNEKKIQSSSLVMAMNHVSEVLRMDAVDLIMRGYDPDMVIKALEPVQDAPAKFEQMRFHLFNRERLAQYHRDHPDPKFSDE